MKPSYSKLLSTGVQLQFAPLHVGDAEEMVASMAMSGDEEKQHKHALGRAVQIDPMKPTLRAPGSKRS